MGLLQVFDVAAQQSKIKQAAKLNLPQISVQSANMTTGVGSQRTNDNHYQQAIGISQSNLVHYF
jgi:hypothetical protein